MCLLPFRVNYAKPAICFLYTWCSCSGALMWYWLLFPCRVLTVTVFDKYLKTQQWVFIQKFVYYYLVVQWMKHGTGS